MRLEGAAAALACDGLDDCICSGWVAGVSAKSEVRSDTVR